MENRNSQIRAILISIFSEEIVRRHIKWDRFASLLMEGLLTSLFDIMRRFCGIASAGVR